MLVPVETFLEEFSEVGLGFGSDDVPLPLKVVARINGGFLAATTSKVLERWAKMPPTSSRIASSNKDGHQVHPAMSRARGTVRGTAARA